MDQIARAHTMCGSNPALFDPVVQSILAQWAGHSPPPASLPPAKAGRREGAAREGIRGRDSGVGRGRGCRQALAVHAVSRPGHGPRDCPAGAALAVEDGCLPRKHAPHRQPPWARGRRARVCDHPELGVDAPSAPAYIRERSRALPVCDYLRQARQTTLGESGVAKPAECNLKGILQQCTIFIYIIHIFAGSTL